MARILIIGAGGHARVVIDAIRAAGEHEIAGLVTADGCGEPVYGVPVVAADADLGRLRSEVDACIIAVGSVGGVTARLRAAQAAQDAGVPLVTIVHPAASVSAVATLTDGAFVGAGAVVGPGASVGECAIVNSGAVVDHDCNIGAFVHVAPGAALSGTVSVGDRSHIGTGASVMQGIRIGADTVIGVGAVVVDDVPGCVVAYGNPCRVAHQRGA